MTYSPQDIPIGCTLEELASLASPVSNVSDTAAAERENKAKLLDGLMWMNDQGYIFLNSDNEKSLITIKGLMEINNKMLCN